ncbi:hypothetical protein D3C78_1276990 [compost metagenome]
MHPQGRNLSEDAIHLRRQCFQRLPLPRAEIDACISLGADLKQVVIDQVIVFRRQPGSYHCQQQQPQPVPDAAPAARLRPQHLQKDHQSQGTPHGQGVNSDHMRAHDGNKKHACTEHQVVSPPPAFASLQCSYEGQQRQQEPGNQEGILVVLAVPHQC